MARACPKPNTPECRIVSPNGAEFDSPGRSWQRQRSPGCNDDERRSPNRGVTVMFVGCSMNLTPLGLPFSHRLRPRAPPTFVGCALGCRILPRWGGWPESDQKQNPLLITDFQHALAKSSRHANNLTVSSTNLANLHESPTGFASQLMESISFSFVLFGLFVKNRGSPFRCLGSAFGQLRDAHSYSTETRWRRFAAIVARKCLIDPGIFDHVLRPIGG